MTNGSKKIINSMSVKSKDVNWNNYYSNIRDVCPWSAYAYMEGKLFHTQFKSWNLAVQNESMMVPMKLWAIAYLDCPFSVDEMDAWVEQRNKEQTLIQYYFSHPEHDPNGRASPVPMLIQQRRDILDMARKGVFTAGIEGGFHPDKMVDNYLKTGKASGGTRGKWERTPEVIAKVKASIRKRNNPDKNE